MQDNLRVKAKRARQFTILFHFSLFIVSLCFYHLTQFLFFHHLRPSSCAFITWPSSCVFITWPSSYAFMTWPICVIPQLLFNLILLCLQMTFEENLKSIAFPTLGCGQMNFDPSIVSDCFNRAALQFDHDMQVLIDDCFILLFYYDIVWFVTIYSIAYLNVLSWVLIALV